MNKTLLLIDDDQIEHIKLKKVISKSKIDCKIVSLFDGEQGLEYLKTNKHNLPDFILLDLNMPKMDGFELLEYIKEDSVLKRVPVVVITTSNAEKDKTKSFDLQVAGYMIKPTELKDYADLISKIMSYLSSSFSMTEALEALQKYWNYADFRTDQKKVIECLAQGHDVIALLPTGGGKSLCYQVPALINEGLTLVVSPLIALMEDQVQSLRAKGIAAERIHSGLRNIDIDRILGNVVLGKVKLLYVAPERLCQEQFVAFCRRRRIDLVAVDEAHCISQWGHDFRPSYLSIHEFLQSVGNPQLIALTATATAQVIKEVKASLRIPSAVIIKASFQRANIGVSIQATEDKIGQLEKLITTHDSKTIIYVRSRRQVQMIAKILRGQGVAATYFHAGLPYKLKKIRQEKFKIGDVSVVVATNAFGMGIDISDIGMIIHYDIPPSIEEYYQEIGRAGRDGSDSHAIVLVSEDDLNFKSRRMIDDFPAFDVLKEFYHRLHVNYNIPPLDGEGQLRDLSIDLLTNSKQWNYNLVNSCLHKWQSLGQIDLIEEDKNLMLVKMNCSPREARDFEAKLGKTYNLLDHLMRSHEGIFDQWVTIDTERMSSRFKVQEEYLITKLNTLRQAGALKLFTQESGTKIRFKNNRWLNRDLEQFRSMYDQLKTMHQDRWNNIRELLGEKNCRMQYILNYFDEPGIQECGRCDNCSDEGKNNSSIDNKISEQRRINEA